MGEKFGRNYRLTVETADGGGAIVIQPPLTVQFTINRAMYATLNTMDIAVYNLGDKTRQRIFKDRFTLTQYQRIVFEAGYDQLSTLFIGSVYEANTQRNGVNLLTNINSRDGDFDVTGSKTYLAIQKGATNKDVVQQLIKNFPNVKEGILGDGLTDTFKRPVILEGSTYDLIRKYTNDRSFIDLEKLNVLQDSEVVEGDLPLISDATGLLNVPRRDDAILVVDTIFEPRIILGQMVKLESKVLPVYNGAYKVVGIQHTGIISEAVNGDCRSTFTLLTEGQVFGEFKSVG